MRKSTKKLSILLLSVLMILSCVFATACAKTAPKVEQKINFNVASKEFVIEVGGEKGILVDYNGTENITFVSDNTQIATVTDRGVISAVSEGVTHVKVSAGKFSEYCKVTVKNAEYQIIFGMEKVVAVLGSKQQLVATALTNGVEDLTATLTWEVLDAKTEDYELISSAKSAQFKANKVGSYTVKASNDNTSATCQIKVVATDAIRLNAPEISVTDCTKLTWTAVANAKAYNVLVGGSNEWIRTEETSIDLTSYYVDNNAILHGDNAQVFIIALAEEDYTILDSYVTSVILTHDYKMEAQGTLSCDEAGVMKFTCEDCGFSYTDAHYYAEHEYDEKTLICKVCSKEKTNNVMYGYDDNHIPMPSEVEADDPNSAWSIKYFDYYKNSLKNQWNKLVEDKTSEKYGQPSIDNVDDMTQEQLDFARKKLARSHQSLWTAVFRNKDNIPVEDRVQCYNVLKYNGKDQDTVWIRETYDDGTHGELPVMYVSQLAFNDVTDVKKVIFPESVTELKGECFRKSSIETIILPGVTFLPMIDIADYQTNNFNYCYSLKKLVLGEGITIYGRNFYLQKFPEGYESSCTIYVQGDGGVQIQYKDYTHSLNLIANGVVEYHYQPENVDNYVCGLWFYDEDMNVVLKNHEYDFDTCLHCGAKNTFGLRYSYDVNTKTYYVSNSSALTKSVVNVLDTYNDMVHGEAPVTKIGNGAFRNNSFVREVYLPQSVTMLGEYAFYNCDNLRIVDMSGVTNLARMEASNALNECGSLEKVIVNKNLNLEAVQSFSREVGDDDKPADVYVYGSPEESTNLNMLYTTTVYDSEGKLSSLSNSRNLGGAKYYYSETVTCGRWSFVGGKPVYKPHVDNNSDGICDTCDTNTQSYGIRYEYFEVVKEEVITSRGYQIVGLSDKSLTEIKPLSSFNDGVHGRLDVIQVRDTAFRYNKTITKVILPDTVRTLGNGAFEGCSNLTYVQVRGVNAINEGRFLNCDKLETLIVGCRVFIGTAFKSDTLTQGNLVIFWDTSVKNGNGDNLTVEIGSNLFAGKIYIFSETEKDGCFHYVNGVATPWNSSYYSYDNKGTSTTNDDVKTLVIPNA